MRLTPAEVTAGAYLVEAAVVFVCLVKIPKYLRAIRVSWRKIRAARTERDWEKSWSRYAEQRRAGEIAKRRENQPKVRHHSADFRPDSE